MELQELKDLLELEGNEGLRDGVKYLFTPTITEVETFLDTEEGKRLLQPKLDRYHSKGLESHIEKNKDKFVSVEEYEALRLDNANKIAEFENKTKVDTLNFKIKEALLGANIDKEYLELVADKIDTQGLVVDNNILIGQAELVQNAVSKFPKLFNVKEQSEVVIEKANVNNGTAVGNPPKAKATSFADSFRKGAGLK